MIEFVMANWDTLLLIGTGAVTVASAIVKLTPTPKDDAWLAKILGILNVIAINKKKQP